MFNVRDDDGVVMVLHRSPVQHWCIRVACDAAMMIMNHMIVHIYLNMNKYWQCVWMMLMLLLLRLVWYSMRMMMITIVDYFDCWLMTNSMHNSHSNSPASIDYEWQLNLIALYPCAMWLFMWMDVCMRTYECVCVYEWGFVFLHIFAEAEMRRSPILMTWWQTEEESDAEGRKEEKYNKSIIHSFIQSIKGHKPYLSIILPKFNFLSLTFHSAKPWYSPARHYVAELIFVMR